MSRTKQLPRRWQDRESREFAREAESLLEWLESDCIRKVWCLDKYSAVTAYTGCDWLSPVLSLRVGEADLDYLYYDALPCYNALLSPQYGRISFGFSGDSCSWFDDDGPVVCANVQASNDTVDTVDVGFKGQHVYCRHPMNVFTSLFIPLMQGLSRQPDLDLVACTLLVEADAMSFNPRDVVRIIKEVGRCSLEDMLRVVKGYGLDLDGVPGVYGLVNGKLLLCITRKECIEAIDMAMEATKGE